MNALQLPPDLLAEFVRGMPKAELHLHIEGTLEPELIFELAQRNAVSLPYPSVEALRAAYAFTNLQSFLDIYYAGASVLLTEQDFFDMAWAYFLRAKADNIIHAELFFDPQTHTARGVPITTIIDGLRRAADRALEELGIRAELIMCFLRHLSEAEALTTLEKSLRHLGKFIGVGLDSGEVGNPPEKFTKAFRVAKALGLRRVAHAGEEGPPEYISGALDALLCERIDHGVQVLRDPALVARLVEQRIPLTVCPLSNVKLCVFPSLREHNLRELLDQGLVVTINSDDPAYFGGYLNQNFVETFAALDLNVEHALTLACNSFEACFATDEQKREYLAQLDAWCATFSAAHGLSIGIDG